MEGRKYPFMGIMAHPEKPAHTFYDYPDSKDVNHSWLSIQTNQHFVNAFIQLARQNSN